MPITRSLFGATADGTSIDSYTLRNTNGLEAQVMTYGATLLTLRVPNRDGALADVVLGFDTLEPYLHPHPFFGGTIGRYGNRIAHGRFTLDGTTYTLDRNNGPNHLHGGPMGFHRVVWHADQRGTDDEPAVALSYRSRDGEEGYPGNLDVIITYTLSAQNGLRIDYQATTDAPTVLNLTNHTYFNLAGSGDILGHELHLDAAHFLPTDATLIPLGELRAVRGTPMDFTAPTPVGARVAEDDEQLRLAHGYDHNWVLDKPGAALALAGQLYDSASGRLMKFYTTQPGVQFYDGNQLDGSGVGKGGQVYAPHAGLCLETQHFPDSPNQPAFPSTVLRPGETYQHTTIYQFSTK